MSAVVTRHAARIFLIDSRDRILLFRCDDPRIQPVPFWITPGGGVDQGESLPEAASRELREETGYRLAPAAMGPAIAITEGTVPAFLPFDHAVDTFFLVRVDGDTPLDMSGQEAHERSVLTRHRWWTLDDLRDTREMVVPVGLADLMPRLLDDELPDAPIRLAWHH